MRPPRTIAVAIDLGALFPHHQEVFEGVRRYAVEQGNWRCCLDEHPGYRSRSRGSEYPHYDGVIARLTDDLLRRLVRMRLPLVNTHYQQARPRVAGVYHDPCAIGLLAARHLVDRGCQRLSLLGLPGDRHWEDSCDAVRGWARGHGIECEIESVEPWPYRNAPAWLESEKRLRAWLKRIRPPLGVYVGRAQIARLLHQFVVAEGLRVPNDIAILCCRDATPILELEPRISYIRPDHRRVGYEAARLLDRLMAGSGIPAEPLLVPPIDVVARESTGFVRADDSLVAAALAHIEAHIGAPLRVDDLAAELAVSRRLLQKRFADVLGRGVSHEVRRLRVEAAKRLLHDPERTIDQVARASGFGTRHAMSEVFRRELGVSPADYRNRAIKP